MAKKREALLPTAATDSHEASFFLPKNGQAMTMKK